eukprot:Gregarina_sp_Poly_1__3402@NODE_1986_length_2937_cov_844_697213_g1280_i0_p1_GENE_NODE_1986_length_2937_cov_844_697213_g1280_i0NODE_1986_length_2937_cov_844_697213_g1280_i0_p1_ORF_typecomplete_len325_score27_08zfCCCH/PF00642_24/2_4e08zfCCCH/PF00642_24/0_0018zfCCCH_3/PF15663_5/3e10zf_CCCH_4/PF18345_1/3_5e08zf_CCCH_4/PF18345_1/1_9e02Torus/PF16131_5/0_048Torus/PF16131_5/0_051zfCCCH_4/PF18044_1/1_7e05zfCCCH_4/PF18044_1/1_7e03zfCCCH_4/PF18044_1/2_5e03zfCCCH_2/PF14608_6/0_016zfCCCH_2/PF14608_6/1_5e02zfC
MTAQRLQCFKTKRCRFWLENRCSRGDKCTYAHTDVELRCPPDLTKTKICTRWKRGACDKAPDECAYAHGAEDLRDDHASAAVSSADKTAGFSADSMTPSTSSGTLASSSPDSAKTSSLLSSGHRTSAFSSCSSSSGIRTIIGSQVFSARAELEVTNSRPEHPRVPRLPLDQHHQRLPQCVTNEYSVDFTHNSGLEVKETARSVQSFASTTVPSSTPGTQRSFASSTFEGFPVSARHYVTEPDYAGDAHACGAVEPVQFASGCSPLDDNDETSYYGVHTKPWLNRELYDTSYPSLVSNETLCLISALCSPYYD